MPTNKLSNGLNTNNDTKILFNFKILHRMGKPLGLSCYTLPADDETQSIKVTTFDILIFSVVNFLNIYLTHYNYQFWKSEFKMHEKDTIFTTGIIFITTGTLLFTLVGSFVMLFMRERIWYVVVTLQDIIIKAEKYGMKMTNTGRRSSVLLCYLICSGVTVYTIFFVYAAYMTYYLGYFDYYFLVSQIKANITFAYACWKCQFLIFAIGLRFHLLNTMFEKEIDAALLDPNAIEKSQLIGDLIFIVGDFHDVLNSLAEKLNTYFAIVILPIYAGNFFITVFSCHNLYKSFVSNDSTFYYLSLYFLLMAIYFNISVIFITLGSAWTKKKADRIGVLVHKTMAKTQDKHILQRLHILSQQTLHVSPTFSCGLFAMDWPMQFTFVSALTSYLIILIQFQEYITNGSSSSSSDGGEQFSERNGSIIPRI